MTPGKTGGVVRIDDTVHAIRSSGYIGGTTECSASFQWAEQRERRVLRGEGLADLRNIGHSSRASVTCLLCLGDVS